MHPTAVLFFKSVRVISVANFIVQSFFVITPLIIEYPAGNVIVPEPVIVNPSKSVVISFKETCELERTEILYLFT